MVKSAMMPRDSIVNKLRDLQITTNIPVASNTFYLSSGAQGISVFKMQEYLNEIAASNKYLRPIDWIWHVWLKNDNDGTAVPEVLP